MATLNAAIPVRKNINSILLKPRFASKLIRAGCLVVTSLSAAVFAAPHYESWKHAGSFWVLTTPEGANLAATTTEVDFPLLVRLNQDFFDFQQAGSRGQDIRFTTPSDIPLAYEIEQWDSSNRVASIWVRVPRINGDERQELKMFWGNESAASESSGKSVFNESNGYVSVWHMNAALKDEVGTLTPADEGTSAARGVIGEARHLAGDQGIIGGDKITSFPTGAGPMSTEAWFKAEKPNTTVLAWGEERRAGKLMMNYRSPGTLAIQCYFADVAGKSVLARSQWHQVVHTYQNRESRVYVNGQIDGSSQPVLNFSNSAGMWIGGWHGDYNFVGDVDEVRISKVARSADWVRLQYENQKAMPTLVGPLVQPGQEFSVSHSSITLREGANAAISAKAGGAQKIYWIVKWDGQETVAAVDQLDFTFAAGRVSGDKTLALQLKAIYPGEVRTLDIPVKIREAIPEPDFTLAAPATWNGRDRIEVSARILNLDALGSGRASKLNYAWTVSGIATTREEAGQKLILSRAQNSGPLTVELTVDNGGAPATHTIKIAVQEPARDPWVRRAPGSEERPEDNQFYAREDDNLGRLYCNGMIKKPSDSVFINVFKEDRLYERQTAKLPADQSYAFTVTLKPGLTKYRMEMGARTGDVESLLYAATNLVCGDAFLIDGQSNAEATEFGEENYTYTSDWIRTFGSPYSDRENGRWRCWGNAVARHKGGRLAIGYWGLELARRLVESQKIPICIINGAVGGTRIDQHQRNPMDQEDVDTIYGRLLWRVEQARLTHGIRGVFWHQGENDQGADGPTGGYGWETYRQFFFDMSAAWKQNYPNIAHYYMFQIWPKSCGMGVNGSDNRLREVQRRLPRAFSNMRIMSTLGVTPPGSCHYPPAGYAEFARRICPLVERDNYGRLSTNSLTPPDLLHAFFKDDKKNEVVMEFDQPVEWDDQLIGEFYLDGKKGLVASGSVSGKRVKLQLTGSTTAQTITYLDSKNWSQARLLRGQNGIAALTFCEVSIQPVEPTPSYLFK